MSKTLCMAVLLLAGCIGEPTSVPGPSGVGADVPPVAVKVAPDRTDEVLQAISSHESAEAGHREALLEAIKTIGSAPAPSVKASEKSAAVSEAPVVFRVLLFYPLWCAPCVAKAKTCVGEQYQHITDELKFPPELRAKTSWSGPEAYWEDSTSKTGWRRAVIQGKDHLLDLLKAAKQPLATGEAAHTPMSEVVRVLDLLPKPEVAFVDFGCGYDARWCVAAAERWGCKCVGIELDSDRASAARERIRNLGLDHLITIVEGDAGTVPVSGDVAVAYLYPDLLARLKPRLESFKVFASYLHQPPGLNCTKNGDIWLYRRQVQLSQSPQRQGAVWGGAYYNQRVCNNPHCAMCNSIQRQLSY